MNAGRTLVVVASLVGAAAMAGCIPDLPAEGGASMDAAPVDAGAVETSALDAASLCGNGVIDLDAGEQCDPGSNAGSPSFTACTAQCRMDCPGGHVGAANHHCYEVVSGEQLLERAIDRCSDLSMAHVVTFASPAEVSDVDRWLGTLDAGAYWVGMMGLASLPNQYGSLATDEPGWAPTCPGCFARVDDPTAPFPLFVPDAAAPTTGCVATRPDVDATYTRAACSEPAAVGVVCEHEPAGDLHVPCDGGVCIQLVATYGSRRYLYVPELVTAMQARTSCSDLGGRLVVLRTQEEREELWRELALLSSSPSSIWIGLGEASTADGGLAWVWTDGASVDAYPSPWGQNEPKAEGSGAWAYASSTGTVDITLAFADLHPISVRTYVCEFDAGTN